MASPKVIVFGPTGSVGRIVARTAQQNGAKVYLGMRDPSKPIPGLSAADETAGQFERIQADTTQPDTVREAVHKTGATRAFLYLSHGQPDHMQATLEALKAAGIEFVVFLSSYTILRNDPKDFPPADYIPYAHAQVEIRLSEIFGDDNYVALRPGGFSTNASMWYGDGIKAGKVRMFAPEAAFDCITPDDMGAVGGVVLAKGAQDGQRIVYLFGPEMVQQQDVIRIISDVLGKEVKVEWTDAEGAKQGFIDSGQPPPIAGYLAGRIGDVGPEGFEADCPGLHAEGVENIKKYLGRPALDFRTWVEANKDLFTA